MNNYRKPIQIAFFAICSLVFFDSNGQEISYEYDTDRFGAGSVGVGGNGGRIVSVASTQSQSTVNRNNDYQNSGQSNQRRATNQLTEVYQPSSPGAFNREYVTSRPSQRKPTQQQTPEPSLNKYSNNIGASNSNQPILQSTDRNSVYNNNKNYNGISGFQSTGQGNQRRPVQQDSSESLFRSGVNSYQSQQTLDRNKNFNKNGNSESPLQSNGQSNQGRPTNNQFNPSDNGFKTSTNQRTTTLSPQFLERDTVNNNNGNSNDNYHQNSEQWNAIPPKNKGGGSTLGIIESNDGYVQPRPSQDLDRNTHINTNADINNPNYEASSSINNKNVHAVPSSRPTQSSVDRFSYPNKNSLTENNDNYQSNFQPGLGKPINQIEGSDQNNHKNQFVDSENFKDSHEAKPVPTFNRQNTDNGNKPISKIKNNNNVNNGVNGNINGNRPSNVNGNMNNNGMESGKKPSNNRHSQISAGHQGNKIVDKLNVIGLINSSGNKNSDSSESDSEKKEKETNKGGNIKKRVSQIKYEQYLASIFPDLDNEDVQEVKDFRGRKLARPGQFPHMGAIGFKNHVINKTEYKCGASLISDIWAITTAHCTKYNNLTPTYVRFGDLNLKAAEEDVDPQTRKISRIVNHPSYKDTSLYNDIALLQLDKVLIFTEFVQPIRIWYQDEIPFTMAYAMGFGAVQFAGAQTNRLTQLDLTIVPNDICASQMPKQPDAKQGIISSQICAIDNSKTGSDTFQGDSGGPLEISFYAEEGGRQRQYLIGMTSFGVVGTTRLPGVYTRVSSYVDWIEKTVWSSEYNALHQ